MTIPDVFIIESLQRQYGRYGKLLADNIRASGKNPIFTTVSNKDELIHSLLLFKASEYRYLHIICHGTEDSIALADANSFNEEMPNATTERINAEDFTSCFPKGLGSFRLFCSSCSLGNQNFVESILQLCNSLCSVAAPCEEINENKALYVWTTFYQQIFAREIGNNKLISSDVKRFLQESVNIFNENFQYSYSHTDNNHNGEISHFKICPQILIKNRQKNKKKVSGVHSDEQ